MVFLYSETGSSPKIPSPSTSAATKGEQKPSLGNDKTPKLKEALDEAKPVVSPQKVIEKEMSAEVAADVSSMKHKNVILFIVLFFPPSMVCIYYFARRLQVGKRISIWQDNASLLLLLPFHVFVLLFLYFFIFKKGRESCYFAQVSIKFKYTKMFRCLAAAASAFAHKS